MLRSRSRPTFRLGTAELPGNEKKKATLMKRLTTLLVQKKIAALPDHTFSNIKVIVFFGHGF